MDKSESNQQLPCNVTGPVCAEFEPILSADALEFVALLTRCLLYTSDAADE